MFARAGCETRIHDRDQAQIDRALAWLDEDLDLSVAGGWLGAGEADGIRSRVSTHSELEDALAGADYVQESGPERLDAKRELFRALDGSAPSAAILASSTSTFDMTVIADGLAGASRCIVAHPTNPPHVIPAVEVLPGASTDPAVVSRTMNFLRQAGQVPVLLRKYTFGFVLNRLQAALVREAIDLVESGVADVEAVDTIVREGLGLRWAIMGPFVTGHTNADGGLREYYGRYGSSYRALIQALDPAAPAFDGEMIDRLSTATEGLVGGATVADLLRWRDDMIRRIRALKSQHPGA